MGTNNALLASVGWIHFGNIRQDEVTKGYDYYGWTSNTAARTESVGNGGQVLLTGAAYLALSTAEREQLDVTALGGVALCGVPVPVAMYQLNAVPGRTFAALRLDRQDVDACDEVDDGASSSDHDSINSKFNDHAKWIMSVLMTVFGAFTPQQQLNEVLLCCERWSIQVPPKAPSMPDDLYCSRLVSFLAQRLEKVMQRQGLLERQMSLTSTVSNSGGRSLLHCFFASSYGESFLRSGATVGTSFRRHSVELQSGPADVQDCTTGSVSATGSIQRDDPLTATPTTLK
ncbi:putative receptor-type adenylate cyclase [Trypanosoma grayi]|uniref:putative receptor-type adenylate cyclase n=1 Tax=Trypanosoma grayi TaxID=71804 RepID=UPI0004F4BC51|nr:putative receptor-type adenylate cyclase [Trypanosoma grayi]KEG09072.1 putative receptor-type adenylate cyclase [Trypanosoma grayi]